MNAATSDSNGRIEPQRAGQGGPQLRTILLTDLVDSTALVERLGDNAAAELFRAHDRLVLGLQQHWRGRLIDRSDGMLLLFERPIDGLGFALDYNRGLLELGAPHGVEIKARAGLHVGEVLTWRNSEESVRVGAKPVEVEGLAKPMAGRLMTTARPGQILLSAVAEPLAHRAARELGERGQHLLWKSHGRWRFKGVPEAQQIFEVGEAGVAPLRTPANSPKAWRDVPLWRRPAALAAELAVVAALAIGIWFITKPQPAIAFNERDWVVLADLRNLTGEPLLDDSLEQAFRISLEQSRHVNVLSDLKTRDTLARMQLGLDTELDRTIASEVAIRDGARAVILPTVAEVGGHLRISAEIIDPHSQTTVYAEYADGRGTSSALASVDDVTAALRNDLGEALELVAQHSKPLPEVTTESLDALKAYALGVGAYGERKFSEALQYFDRAIALDPGFALAYLGALRLHVSAIDSKSATEYLAKAVSLKEHLMPRDALYLEAWVAEFGPRSAIVAPAKWKLLADLYPDYYAGHANYAWSAFLANNYAEALKYAQAASAPQNPLRSTALELIARIQLAQERRETALVTFERAEAEGGYGPNRRRAAALAAMRRFEEAQQVLAQLPEQGWAGADISNEFERISIALDQGRMQQALAAAARARELADASGSTLLMNEFRFIEQSVIAVAEPDELDFAQLDRIMDLAMREAAEPGLRDRGTQIYIAISSAYLAQRAGKSRLTETTLQKLGDLVDQIADPAAVQMFTVLQAGRHRLSGDPERAVNLLRPLVDGRELFQVHVALRDAFRASGSHEEALEQGEWIAAHRGRAYMEAAGDLALQAMNVADTTLALLENAEVARSSGQEDQGKALAKAFARAWRLSELPAYLRRRVAMTLPASNA